MSAAPDPSDLAPSRDPAAYGKRPLFTASFFAWAVLCVICVLAGAALGRFGVPRMAAKPEAPAAAAPGPAPSAAAPALTLAAPPVLSPSPPPAGDQGLSDRVARLEQASGHADMAAVDALAAASLSVAAEGAAPFDQDVAAYERLAPGDPDLQALLPLAASGAPSRAALAAAFPDLAAKAAMAARAPDPNASFLARLWGALGQVVIVRRVDPAGPGIDGLLTRAEDQAAAGDLAAAVQSVQALPPKARAPLTDWLAAAQRRLEIDRRIGALRARALAALAAQPPSAPPTGTPSGAPP